jgi:hypothetical protein
LQPHLKERVAWGYNEVFKATAAAKLQLQDTCLHGVQVLALKAPGAIQSAHTCREARHATCLLEVNKFTHWITTKSGLVLPQLEMHHADTMQHAKTNRHACHLARPRALYAMPSLAGLQAYPHMGA